MLTEDLTQTSLELEEEAPLAALFEQRAAEIAQLAVMPLPVTGAEQTVDSEVIAEIRVVEQRLKENEAETEQNMNSDRFNLGLSLKLKEEKIELTSYLKGLQFHAKKATR